MYIILYPSIMQMKKELLTKLSFVTKVAKMGDKRIIVIPKDLHSQIPKSRQVRILIEDEV